MICFRQRNASGIDSYNFQEEPVCHPRVLCTSLKWGSSRDWSLLVAWWEPSVVKLPCHSPTAPHVQAGKQEIPFCCCCCCSFKPLQFLDFFCYCAITQPILTNVGRGKSHQGNSKGWSPWQLWVEPVSGNHPLTIPESTFASDFTCFSDCDHSGRGDREIQMSSFFLCENVSSLLRGSDEQGSAFW